MPGTNPSGFMSVDTGVALTLVLSSTLLKRDSQDTTQQRLLYADLSA